MADLDTTAFAIPVPPLLPDSPKLMAGFERHRIRTRGAEIEVAVAGNGPPLLLLHGNPDAVDRLLGSRTVDDEAKEALEAVEMAREEEHAA